jgi:hypothetical protein
MRRTRVCTHVAACHMLQPGISQNKKSTNLQQTRYKTTPHAPPSMPPQNKTEGTKRWRLSLSLFLSLCLSHAPWRMSQAHQPPSSPLLPASSASCTTLRRSSRIEEVLRCRSSSGSALRESSADKVSSGLQIAQDKHTWLCDPCYATLRSDVGGSTYIENHEPLQTFPHITQRAYTCLRMA